jgi:asparagine N-glycosylation enzyme membrane subunit Stt3
MHINDIVVYTRGSAPKPVIRPFGIVAQECSQYLKESNGRPLYRSFNTHSSPITDNLYKIKVRHKKATETALTEMYSNALVPKLRERSVFTYGTLREAKEGEAQYYVFPKDGYKYLYSKEITDSNDEYKQVIDTLIETVSYDRAYEIVTEMLKFTYSNTNLLEGIQEDAEILFYNIPYFYAVPVQSCSSYEEVLKKIRGE